MDEELSQPRGAQAFVVSHLDSCPFRTTLCCLPNKKNQKVRTLPYTLIHLKELRNYNRK